jgi:hypothetical protein
MSITIEVLEMSVKNLPLSDLSKFRNWFMEFDAARWDAQIESDGAAGKLNALAEDALTEYRLGQAREF